MPHSVKIEAQLLLFDNYFVVKCCSFSCGPILLILLLGGLEVPAKSLILSFFPWAPDPQGGGSPWSQSFHTVSSILTPQPNGVHNPSHPLGLILPEELRNELPISFGDISFSGSSSYPHPQD